MKGADPVALFTNVPALMIVFLGTIGAVWTSHTQKENLSALKSLKIVFKKGPDQHLPAVIKRLADYAGVVRAEGVVALEQKLKDEPDPFVKRALILAMEGNDPAVMKESLKREINAVKERHKVNANWFQSAGIFSPTLGIIGAVVGLIAVMAHMDDPASLGHGIAAAFVATFWGVFLANGLFLPWASKLKRLSAEEIAAKLLIAEGAMQIQSGTNPRVMTETLMATLPMSEREAV
jgi:chemotaxis protein MotA